MRKPVLVFSGPVATRSGYGDHARDLIHSLIKMDKFEIKILSQRWGDTPMNALSIEDSQDREIINRMVFEELREQPEVWIQLTVPNEFQRAGKYNIGITAGIETTACSAPWIEGLNRMDLILVPSEHAKTVFLNTKYEQVNEQKQKTGELICQKPIEVLFEGLDTSIFYKTENLQTGIRRELNDAVKEDFSFLYVGHWLKGNVGEDRKNTGLLVKLFMEVFKDKQNPPALILKTSSATFSEMDREQIYTRVQKIKESVIHKKSIPNVYVIHGDLNMKELNELYNHRKVKAHVTFTKGEGFGRPLLEASVSEKPIIAPGWSGQADFLHKDYTILLDGELKNVDASAVWENVIIPESKWFNVNTNNAGSMLLTVWNNYTNIKKRAVGQANYVRENFTLRQMDKKFEEILNKHMPVIPIKLELKRPKPKITLPKLKKVSLPKLQKRGG